VFYANIYLIFKLYSHIMENKLKEILKNKKLLLLIGGVLLAIIAAVVFLFFFRKKEKTYTITFDTDGGSAIEQIVVKEGESVELPKEPTKEGFKFNGWLLDGQPFVPSTKIVKDIKLVAGWISEDAVTFKVSFNSDNGNPPIEIEVEENTAVKKPTDPEKENATFKGWFLNDVEYDFAQLVTADITLVGHWEEVKKVEKKEEKEEVGEKVDPKPETPPTVEKLTITTPNPLRIWKGKTSKIGVSGVSSATFASNNPAVATVDGSGVVRGVDTKDGGTAIVTVTGSNGEKAQITVYVEYQWITIKTDRTIIAPGITANVTATRAECGMGVCGKPTDLTSQMKFTSSNTDYINISSSGSVRTAIVPRPERIYSTENVTITATFAGLTDSITMKAEGNYLLDGSGSNWTAQPTLYIGTPKSFNVNIASTFSKESGDPRFTISPTFGSRVTVNPILHTVADNPGRLSFETPAGQKRTIIFFIH